MNPTGAPRPRRAGVPARRQRGALSIIAGFSMLALIGMLAVVLDLGHLYIAKTELQNAADACALSAATELATIDGDTSITYGRATTAAIAVGQRNRIDLQRQQTDIAAADLSFSSTFAGPYSGAISAATKYVRCAPQLTNVSSITMWFAGVFGVGGVRMAADAIAKVDSKVNTCALPLALCTASGAGPNLGFTIGQWTVGRLSAGNSVTGSYDWIDFKGVLGATLSDILAGDGQCDLPPGISAVSAKKGGTGGADQAWNTRFGLYGGTYKDPALYKPDTTGYAYTSRSWGLARDAFGEQYPLNYKAQELANAPYNPDAIVDGNGNPAKFPGNPSPASTAVHAAGTPGRRVAVLPVISCGSWDPNGNDEPVVGWVCGLMLAPISDPNTDVRLEVISVSVAPNQQPCKDVPGVGGTVSPKLVR